MKLDGQTGFKGGLQRAVTKALFHAAKRGAEICTPEDLLMRLMTDERAFRAVRAYGGTPERVRTKLAAYFRGNEKPPVEVAVPGPQLLRILERSVRLARTLGRAAGLPEVLGVIQTERDCFAARLLHEEGLNPVDMFVQLMAPRPPVLTEPLDRSALGQRDDVLVGRKSEVDEIMSTLETSRRNSVFLVGESGVGKTAFLMRVGRLLARAPGFTVPVRVLDAVRLVSRAHSRVDLERRSNGVLLELRAEGRGVLLIDNLSVLLAAEAAWGFAGTGGLLGALLWERRWRCVAAVEPREHQAVLERNPFLQRRFQALTLGELGVAETAQALRRARADLATLHGVLYTPAALRKAIELSPNLASERKRPGGTVDLLDRAAAMAKARGRRPAVPVRVGVRDVEKALTRPGMPRGGLETKGRVWLSSLERELKRRIVGQEVACAAVAQAIRLRRAGLGSRERPIGCFLFVGPSGVGKTELARQLAAVIDVPLVRFDMSECSERHSISRLIGAPPGYLGYDKGGLLTEAVHTTPECVLLLDEIEKAHPDIYNLLLQVMDRGCLTESTGRVVDFRHAVLIMTSNVGSREFAAPQPGFVRTAAPPVDNQSLRTTFAPEFRDRLDAIIDFGRLAPPQMRLILERRIAELARELRARRVDLTVTESALAYLVDKGFAATQGARPLVGLLQAKIMRPIADQLLFGTLVRGGAANADCIAGELVLTFGNSRRPRQGRARTAASNGAAPEGAVTGGSPC